MNKKMITSEQLTDATNCRRKSGGKHELKPCHPDASPSCATAIASLKGSRLTLLVPVKG